MRRLLGFLLGAASLLTGGASLHILIPMCLKILYAFLGSQRRRFCDIALVSSRISLLGRAVGGVAATARFCAVPSLVISHDLSHDSSAVGRGLLRGSISLCLEAIELSGGHLAYSLRLNATKC